MHHYYYLQFPQIAAQSSLMALEFGIPFGGTLSWAIVVVMSNDSGQYPYAPLQAALLGWPVTIICDIVFLIPSIVIWILIYVRTRG